MSRLLIFNGSRAASRIFWEEKPTCFSTSTRCVWLFAPFSWLSSLGVPCFPSVCRIRLSRQLLFWRADKLFAQNIGVCIAWPVDNSLCRTHGEESSISLRFLDPFFYKVFLLLSFLINYCLAEKKKNISMIYINRDYLAQKRSITKEFISWQKFP